MTDEMGWAYPPGTLDSDISETFGPPEHVHEWSEWFWFLVGRQHTRRRVCECGAFQSKMEEDDDGST